MTHVPDSLLDGIETVLADGMRADAAALGMREATARVLLALWAPERALDAQEAALGGEDGIPMRELAQRAARDPSTVTRFVLRAAADGLVEQRPGIVDRRERRLHLTPAGQAARAALLARRTTRTAGIRLGVQARTGLGPEQVDWFLSQLYASLVDPKPPSL